MKLKSLSKLTFFIFSTCSFVAAFCQYSGATDVKNLIDAGVGYKLKKGLSLDLTCTNLFNQEYCTFVNMLKIGRCAIVKLTYAFGENKQNHFFSCEILRGGYAPSQNFLTERP